MSEKYFSIREAISHGLKMTKKYWKVIACVAVIYLALQVVSSLLSFKAGGPISRSSVAAVYQDNKTGDKFHQYLQEVGYINRFGFVEEKLQNVKSVSDLVLSADFEAQRQKIYEFLNEHRYRLPFSKSIYYVLAIALWIVGLIISIGWVRISLTASRDQDPSVDELSINVPVLFSFLFASICYSLAVFVGFLLLIIPGIIFSIMFGMYTFLIVDKQIGPIESLKTSCALTEGAKRQLFSFGIVIFFFNIAGFLCLLVGLLFTIPASYIASAYVYDQLLKRSETVADSVATQA